jgi:hypothetical protein
VRKFLSGGIGATVAVAFLFSAGPANAINEYQGLTYEKASDSITSNGGAIKIASRQGSYLPTENCVITGSRRANFLDASGQSSGYTVLVDLNCNDVVAGERPGVSAASEEGRQVASYRRVAKYISKDYADAVAAGKESWCELHLRACEYNCKQAGTCSSEVMEFLGA